MAYATRAQMYTFGVAAAALVSYSDAEQDAALEAASVVADGFLQSAGYVLPLASWGVDLSKQVAIMAAWDLIASRGVVPGQAGSLEVRNAQALDWLRQVGRKEVKPQVVDASATRTGRASAGRPRVLSDTQRGWGQR